MSWIQELEKEVKETIRSLEDKYPQVADMAVVLKYKEEYSKELPNMIVAGRDEAQSPADIIEMSNILSAAHREHIHRGYVGLLQTHLGLIKQLQEHAKHPPQESVEVPTDVGGEIEGE